MSDKQQQPAAEGRRVVFSIWTAPCIRRICSAVSCVSLRRLPLNLLLVIPLLLPIGLALLLLGRAARWPMSLLLWAITFGRSEAKLKALERQFIEVFRQKVTAFPVVQNAAAAVPEEHDAEVWLITGSPERLVEQVYRDSAFLPRVRLIGSRITRAAAAGLDPALPGAQKVVQLEQRLGAPLKLYSGYSDSKAG